MTFRKVVACAALPALVAGLTMASVRAGQQAPAVPQPSAEHQVFKMEAGTWDATVEFVTGPGAPPATSTGVEVNTIGCGGLCLITDFKGEVMGGGFHGHGVTTWDPAKKKYVGSWTDSMSAGLSIGESTWDAAARKFTGWMEGPDMTGKVVKMRTVVDLATPATRVFTAYAPGPDGKEVQTMRITYKRRT